MSFDKSQTMHLLRQMIATLESNQIISAYLRGKISGSYDLGLSLTFGG